MKNKDKKYTEYLELAVMAILFFGLIWLFDKIGFIDNQKPETFEGKFLMITGTIVMVHLVLVVHELGHLITGLIQGFRFELFVVGLLGIKREKEKIKVYLNKNMTYYGGVAASSPVDDSKDNPKKFARLLLAGPIASVLFAVICFLGANYLGPPLGILMYIGGLTSIGIFLATTIPSKTGMFFTDRKRYQRLVTPGNDQDVELAMLSIMGKFGKEESYKNIDRKEMEILMSDDNLAVKYFGLFNMICWQLEHHGKIEEALQENYETTSKKMNKRMVEVFNKEINNYAEKFKVEANIS